MAQRPSIRLLVIGADAAGYAAAACAARSGAAVALTATGGETLPEGAVAEPPNFVWRLLDLHQYGLKFEQPAPKTSLFGDGKAPLSTSDDAGSTGEKLAARDASLEYLWPAFVEQTKRGEAGALTGRTLDCGRYQSANAALDDWFADEDLKTHLVCALVSPFGLAGDEAGSVAALFAGAVSPRRLAAASLFDILKTAAESAGVETAPGRLVALTRGDGKTFTAAMDDGREIRAKAAMASSALIGEAAGLRIAAKGSPLLRRSGAEATIRIRYDRKPKIAAKAMSAGYFTAPDRAAMRRARNNMLEGRIDEDSPLSFEIRGKEIIARAPFCPARLRENGELRDWTGQDRQILGRQAAATIAKRLGSVGTVRDIEVAIGADAASGLKRRTFHASPIPAPPPSHDAIGAAAALALEILRDA